MKSAAARAELPAIYTSNPSEDGEHWFVWDMYRGLPPVPIFIGSMEDAGLVADALNNRTAVAASE